MKMRVVIETFFMSCDSGNCVLDHIILYSDECLMTAGKFHLPFSHFSSSSKTWQTNVKPKRAFLHFTCWLYRGIHAATPKAELVHVIHPVTPGFDGLGSPLFSSWCMTWAGTADVHFLRMALPVAGLLYSLSAALLHLSGEQPPSRARAMFFWWYRQKTRPLT